MVPRRAYKVKVGIDMTAISGRDNVAFVLDLRLLETFREVAARGSFSAAAEALSFTQPAVSQHVARLEKQIGTKLFLRDARGVKPTRAGHLLLRHAEALLESARRAEAEVRAEAGLHVPEVRLGSFMSGAAGLVPMALRELRSAHPDVRPTLRIVEDDAAIDELMAGRVDVSLLIGIDADHVQTRPGMATELLLEDPMLIAMPASHPMARLTSIELADLAQEPWLITCDSSSCEDWRVVRGACDDAGFTPNVQFESEDYQALLGLAASGMGVTMVPALAALSIPADVVIRPIAGDPPKRFIHAAWRDGQTDVAVEAALDALRIACRRLTMSVAQPVNAVAA
jgi:DNA-binding transcriptional LysR family regulator